MRKSAPLKLNDLGVQDKRGATRRTKMSELPAGLKSLVSAAQNCVRLRVALKFSWTKEGTVTSNRLPTSDEMITACLQEAYRRLKANAGIDEGVKAAYKQLNDETGEDSSELRKKVFTVVSE